MSFIWPSMLLLLVSIPFFVLLFVLVHKRRKRMTAHFIRSDQRQGDLSRRLQLQRLVPPVFYLSSLIILFIALARPMAEVNLPRLEGTAILAFDVSGSMAADDISPTRMEAAKSAAGTFAQDMPSSVQIGVVAFSDSGFSVQPPTSNTDDVLAAVSRLSPQRGTSLGEGIITSLRVIAAEFGVDSTDEITQLENDNVQALDLVDESVFESTIIVLLSDGENNMNPDPLEATRLAAEYGVPIYTIGIGSAVGTTVQIDGFVIHSQLDEMVLQEIASISRGSYFNIQDDADLHMAFEEISPMLRVRPERIEITSILTGISIFSMLSGVMFSLTWFRRIP
ncbi:MAG: VWA domain-containing protein [Anaerolineales bacterium]